MIINKGAAGRAQSIHPVQCLSHLDCFRYLYLQFKLTMSGSERGQAGQHYSSQTAKGGNTLKLFILVSSGPPVISVQSILKSCLKCFCFYDVSAFEQTYFVTRVLNKVLKQSNGVHKN